MCKVCGVLGPQSHTNQMKATDKPLTPELLGKMNAYWRAANYLSVGQIYLYDNPLLKEPLKLSHVKPLLVLAQDHPREILYRSAEPVLKPESPQECRGTVRNIVFPTGIDRCAI
jgi:XFP N-terminal domain